jgi:hypothetical protein
MVIASSPPQTHITDVFAMPHQLVTRGSASMSTPAPSATLASV